MYDSTRKKTPGDFICYYVPNASPLQEWTRENVIAPASAILHNQHGIQLHELTFGSHPTHKPGQETYVLYGPTNPLRMTRNEISYLEELSRVNTKVNVMPVYPLTADGQDTPDYELAARLVPALCAELRINIIYATHMEPGVGRTITPEDVCDNVIAETVRIRYEPDQSDSPKALDSIRRCHDVFAESVAQLACLFGRHGLWNRDMTDGSILFRAPGPDGLQWYSSNTRTRKPLMEPTDFSVITGFDSDTARVSFAGEKLPSSDAPELLALSKHLANDAQPCNLLVHFHHPQAHSPRYERITSARRTPHGSFESGRVLHETMRRVGPGVVMRRHGFFWAGHDVEGFEEFLHKIGIAE